VTAACKDCAKSSKILFPPRSGSVNRRVEGSLAPITSEGGNCGNRTQYFRRGKGARQEAGIECKTIVKNLDRLKVEDDCGGLAKTSELRLTEVSRLSKVQRKVVGREGISSTLSAKLNSENLCPNKAYAAKVTRRPVFRRGPARIRSVDEIPPHAKVPLLEGGLKNDTGVNRDFATPKESAMAWRDSPADMSRRIELAKIAHEVYLDYKAKHPSILKRRRPKERFEQWSDSSDEELPKAVRFGQL
jgi:hypothetical protein